MKFKRTVTRYRCHDCGCYNLQKIHDGFVAYICADCGLAHGPLGLDKSDTQVVEWDDEYKGAPEIMPRRKDADGEWTEEGIVQSYQVEDAVQHTLT